MHRTHRADGNQSEIVRALRDTGHSVVVLSQVGGGRPDLLVGRAGVMLLMEVKVPGEYPTTEQLLWHRSHDGLRVVTVTSVAEAIAAMNSVIAKRS